MKIEQIGQLKSRFDRIVIDVLGPLRSTKQINREAVDALTALLDELRLLLADEEYVPRTFVGELWFVFTAMLSEADHAKDPEPILIDAWTVAERLRRIFGPTW
ncbi:MAG TPA: hypothetical protein VF846_21600 [Thermoanaerobaculia bacterium]